MKQSLFNSLNYNSRIIHGPFAVHLRGAAGKRIPRYWWTTRLSVVPVKTLLRRENGPIFVRRLQQPLSFMQLLVVVQSSLDGTALIIIGGNDVQL